MCSPLHNSSAASNGYKRQEEDNVNQLTCLTQNILDINHPESAATLIAEEREQMMLDAADHIRMARVQQMLYRDKVDAARMSAEKPHRERTYTFVVD